MCDLLSSTSSRTTSKFSDRSWLFSKGSIGFQMNDISSAFLRGTIMFPKNPFCCSTAFSGESSLFRTGLLGGARWDEGGEVTSASLFRNHTSGSLNFTFWLLRFGIDLRISHHRALVPLLLLLSKR